MTCFGETPDVACVFVACVTFLQPAPLALVTLAALYPLVAAAAPLCGFAALVTASPLAARSFAVVNALSIVNAAALLAWGAYLFIQHLLPYHFGLALPGALLAVKLATAYCACHYVAHIDHASDSLASRKDYLVDGDFDRAEAKKDGFSFSGVRVPASSASPQMARAPRR